MSKGCLSGSFATRPQASATPQTHSWAPCGARHTHTHAYTPITLWVTHMHVFSKCIAVTHSHYWLTSQSCCLVGVQRLLLLSLVGMACPLFFLFWWEMLVCKMYNTLYDLYTPLLFQMCFNLIYVLLAQLRTSFVVRLNELTVIAIYTH